MKIIKIARGEKIVVATKTRNCKGLGKFKNRWFNSIFITDDFSSVKVFKKSNTK
jgi:hypothetical protein